MRNAFAEALYEAAIKDPRICIVCADISPAGSMEEFRRDFPERFINVGVAEQAMVGIAAGMALKGMKVFCYTIATFALYRAFEFVRDDLCYQNLDVTIVGVGAGVVYSTLGSTHHAMEDVAVASALPNMTVLAPCDPPETDACVRFLCENDHGPVYLRLGKAGEPVLTQYAHPFKFGVPRFLRSITGAKTAILTYGPIADLAVKAASGKPVDVIAFPTLKPFNTVSLHDVIYSYSRIIVVEEHVMRGGLAQRVLSGRDLVGSTTAIDIFTLQDRFIHCYGSYTDILAAHGITVDAIAEAAS